MDLCPDGNTNTLRGFRFGMFKRFILIGLLLPLGLFAQGSQTVYLNLATNINSNPGPLQVTNNIGQSYHSFSVVYGPQTGGGATCISSLPNFQYIYSGVIEASYNGTVYFTVPGQRVAFSDDTSNDTQTKLYRAAGAYPYVRFRTIYFPSSLITGCRVSISYTGSLQSVSLNDIVPQYIIPIVHLTNTCQSLFSTIVQPVQGVVDGASITLNGLNVITSGTSASPTDFEVYTDPN